MKDEKSIERFLNPQEKDYEIALKEIRNGKKESHWIWYIFPQIKGLGRSSIARYYSINSRAEAEEYLRHKVLGARLIKITEVLLGLENTTAEEIFGWPDCLKCKSCMTLFDAVGENPVFGKVLDKFYQGQKDELTLEILAKES